MKANELRIGNLISHDRCDKFRIDEVRLTNEGYILRMYVHRNTLTSYADMKLDEAKPIPLTLELLEKCGFVKVGSNYERDWLLLHTHLKNSTYDFLLYESNSGKLKATPIMYLHQLQNLFFALTGEELQINL